MVSLNYRTSIAHHDRFSACTWPGGAIQVVTPMIVVVSMTLIVTLMGTVT